MRAIVRTFHSPDVENLPTWEPQDPSRFRLLLQVLAGPDNGPGEEAFGIIVCTPSSLAEELDGHAVLLCRHRLIVRTYDWNMIERFLRSLFENVDGDSWKAIASRLSRYGAWEFED